MKNFIKGLLIGVILSLGVPLAVHSQTIVFPPQGGTGFASYTRCDQLVATTTNRFTKVPCGTNGQVWSIVDGFPAWVPTSTLGFSGGAGTLGGSDTQVQFNNNGAFAGDSGFTFNSSTDQLAVTNVTSTSITSTNFSVTGVFNFLGTTITNVATWFSGLFDSNLATKSTTNLTEGSNLYYTEARVQGELLDGNNAVFSNATSTNFNSSLLSFTNSNGISLTTTNLGLTGFTNGSILFTTSSGGVTQDNSNLFWDDVNNRLGIGTAIPAKALQVAGEVNSITSLARGTNVEFVGRDSANSAFFPRAYFYGYSGSAMSNFGFYAASGNATGTTQIPAFSGISTNAVPTQASAIQAINYIDTTKYAIYTTQAESVQRVVPIYIGHFSAPDLTVATNTYIGLGNLTNPTARLSLSASTLAAGGIAFGTDTNLYRVDADKLKTDDTFIASAIGVGIDTPLNPLHVNVNQNSNTSIRVSNGTAGTAAQADFRAYNSSGDFFSLGIYSASTNAYGALTARSGFNYSSGTGGLVLMADNAAGTIRFATGGNTERMRISNIGMVGFGESNPTSRLHLAASTTASGGLDFGGDTNLYRSAADSLTTDDHLYAASTTISGGFFQTGMSDCDDPTTSKLLYDVTTGKYSCGTDQTGGGVGGGSNWTITGGNLTPTSTIGVSLPAGLTIVGHTAFTTATGTSVTSTNANFTTLTFGTAVGTSVTTTNLSVTTNLSLPANSISNASLRQSAGLSVIGRSANTTGNVADITAASDFQVLRRSGTSIAFGSINLASTNAVTGLLPYANFSNGSALSVVGRSANSSGVQASIAGTAGQVLRVTAASVLGFGSLDLQSSAAVSGTLPIANGGTGSNAAIASMFERVVTTTGSTVWTKPTSTRFVGVNVWCVGGGGGGGGAGTADRVGGGGGGGGAAYRTALASQLGVTSSVVVGAAGGGGAAGNNDGTAGGTSSFNSLISCTGGGGGNDGGSGAGGGAGGVGTGGNINGNGRVGADSGLYSDSYRAYGGCAGCNQGDPTTIQDNSAYTFGASGILGQWAGAGAQRVPSWSAASYTGGAGASFGGGGSGGQKAGGGADAAGGAGKQGVVVIQELYQ